MKPEVAALRRRVTELGDMLRGLGLPVGVDAQALALTALAEIGLGDGEDARLALRGVYARSRPAQLVFDEVYPHWLRGERLQPQTEQASPPGAEPELRGSTGGSATEPGSSARGTVGSVDGAWSRYSSTAAAGAAGAAVQGQDGLTDAVRDAGNFLMALKAGKGRRLRPGRRGDVDLRRSMRAARGTAGEVLRLRRRRRRPRPPRVVLLCDFSRSMAGDDRVLLRMAEALLRRSRRTEVFAFSTEIERITGRLRRRDARGALHGLGFAYGGGTRIGRCLRQFVDGWGLRLLGTGSVVVIVSDGLDTGEPQLLREALADLRAGAHKVFWLSPLAGTPGFAPLQGGLRTALPMCDGFGDALAPRALTELVRPTRQRRWQE